MLAKVGYNIIFTVICEMAMPVGTSQGNAFLQIDGEKKNFQF